MGLHESKPIRTDPMRKQMLPTNLAINKQSTVQCGMREHSCA
jgi:hypothetical protein